MLQAGMPDDLGIPGRSSNESHQRDRNRWRYCYISFLGFALRTSRAFLIDTDEVERTKVISLLEHATELAREIGLGTGV